MNDLDAYVANLISGAALRLPRLEPKAIERMLRDDLAYSKRELELARERLADAQGEVRRYQVEVRDAEAALRDKGFTP